MCIGFTIGITKYDGVSDLMAGSSCPAYFNGGSEGSEYLLTGGEAPHFELGVVDLDGCENWRGASEGFWFE